uniref:TetR/AcrR family transcriptional regulator n=1 Tax=Clostridium sp. NkU-1 TaxID=1095009 RepID=UPI000A722E95
MEKKDFKNISVKDITELADLNRGTFYLHYADTYCLLQEMESEVLNDFQDMVSNCRYAFKKDSLLPVVIPIIHYIEENKKICKILFENSSSNDFVNRFHTLVLKKRHSGHQGAVSGCQRSDPELLS